MPSKKGPSRIRQAYQFINFKSFFWPNELGYELRMYE